MEKITEKEIKKEARLIKDNPKRVKKQEERERKEKAKIIRRTVIRHFALGDIVLAVELACRFSWINEKYLKKYVDIVIRKGYKGNAKAAQLAFDISQRIKISKKKREKVYDILVVLVH